MMNLNPRTQQRSVWLTIALCLSLSGLALAQDMPTQGALLPDEARIVRITPEEPALLTYEGRAGEFIDLTARSLPAEDAAEDAPPFDSVISVLGPNLRKIAYNDDSHILEADGSISIQRDAQIRQLRLPRDGSYTIRVDSFNGVSSGQVEILLSESTRFDETIADSDGQTRIDLTLPERAVYAYSFDLAASESLTISAIDPGTGIDPVLLLRNADGEIMAFNDDHGSMVLDLNVLDARLSFTAEETGRYTLEAWDFLGSPGSLRILIQRSVTDRATD